MISWASCLRSNPSEVDLERQLNGETQDLPVGLSRQLPTGNRYAAGCFLMLCTKQRRHGLEKCTASLLFAFLQLYAMPLGAELAASLGSIAAIGPVLLSLTSAFKYQVWGLFQTVLLLENNYQPPCAATALRSSSACRQVGKTLAWMKAAGLGTFINHAFINHLL